MSYRILSIDGGGIRGLVPSRYLFRINHAEGLANLAPPDLIAGTSTGGILALALAAGYTPADCVELYLENAERIFPKSLLGSVEHLWGLEGTKYDGLGLLKVLNEKFGLMKLKDLKRDVLVTTIDLQTRTPIALTRQTYPDLPIVSAAMMTSDAEIYFPSYADRYLDGGNGANNPSLWAVCHAMSGGVPLISSLSVDGPPKYKGIVVASFGTGNANRPPLKPGNWGARQWVQNGLVELLFELPAKLNARLCGELLGDHYRRFDCDVDCGMDETDKTKLQGVVKVVDGLPLADDVAWFKGFWQ